MKSKNIIETIKTIAITVLLTVIIAFAAGFIVGGAFQKQQTQELARQAESISAAAVKPSK